MYQIAPPLICNAFWCRWAADPQGPSFEFQSLPPAYAATQSTSQLALPPNALQVGASPSRSSFDEGFI